ncbi:SDR family NAD(P)-dependent oxidoreductase [Streptomyces sp. NPDC101175]|uniref:SDR family NAD(P)-dependent oxidoreductase n=1 Tax=Streptomyces sp. NPDC101175 TaxID=3366123 RepID=UPI0038342E4C
MTTARTPEPGVLADAVRPAPGGGTRRPDAGALAGRTVLITGASRGLGRFFADVCAGAGARLVLTARSSRPLLDAADELRARDTEVLAVPADVTDPRAMSRAVERAVAAYGAVDVLVNNAGVPGPLGPLWETDPDQWWHTLDTNVRGTVRACQAVLPGMLSGRGGRIVNIVSEAGHHRWPHASAYSVSKAAVIKLTENLAAELRPHPVSVFAFHPGLLDLGITRSHLARHPTGDRWTDMVGDWLVDQRDSGRFAAPGDTARMLLRLASGEADRHSGRYLTPDTAIGDTHDGHAQGR